MSYQTDALLKASRQAANIAIGAEKLFNELFRLNLLPGTASYHAARAYCDALTAESKAADAALQAQVAAEREAERLRVLAIQCPITPLDHFHAACEAQRVGLGVMGKLQAA